MHNIRNGLTLKKTQSLAQTDLTFDDLDSIKNYITAQSDVLAYLDNEVLIGKYDGNLLVPENKIIEKQFIRRMRIFNQNEELLIWRCSDGILKGRFRTDKEGGEIDFIEADQVIYGTKAEHKDNYTILTEKRGTRITVSGEWIADNKRSRVAIRTRHYIGYKNDYQATYIDARFVKFVQLPEGGE